MKSKQLSIISKQPKSSDYDFFVDRQIDGESLCKFLRDAGMIIQRHSKHFPPEAPDDVWIRDVATRGWISITADRNIERDYLDVICETEARLIILTDNSSGYTQWSAAIVAAQDHILKILSDKTGPLVIRLTRHGTVSKVREPDELRAQRTRAETRKIIREKKARV